ncbi:MAG: hypothetical protein AAB397_03560 [Patescibacteria group bacterium]
MITGLNNQIVKIAERLSEKTIKILEALEKRSPDAASLLLKKYSRLKNALKSGNIAAWKKIKTEEEKNFREFFQELEKAADIDDIKKRIRKFKDKK